MGGIVSNTNPGSFIVPGAYVFEAPNQPVTPTGPNTSVLGIVGTSSYGPVGIPTRFTNASSAIAAFGDLDTDAHSIISEALNAMPECQQMIGLRVTDGTDTAATITILDTNTPTAGTLVTLTAKNTGSYANKATWKLVLASGTLSVSPVLTLYVNFPNANGEVFANIISYATLGSAFDAPTFKANLIAAINTGTSKASPSAFWVASSGSGTHNPANLSTLANASGGTDGTTTITSSTLIGTDGNTGRTGIYALRGTIQGGVLIVAGLTDPTVAQTIAAFCQSESNMAVVLLGAEGITTDAAVAAKNTDNVSSSFLYAVQDWESTFDVLQGTTRLVSPLGAVGGTIASLAPYQDPINKPYGGKAGMLGTERTISTSQPLSSGEQQERALNDISYFTNTLRPGGFVLADDHMSDGSLLSDTRMRNFIALTCLQIGTNFVGELQSTDANDVTRIHFANALKAFLNGLLQPPAPGLSRQINAFQVIADASNNTTTTIEQGFLIANVIVQTLTGVRFALTVLQVGNTAQVSMTQVPTTP